MREELEKLVATGKIGRHHVEPLAALVEAGFCSHRSWGFGRITTVDTVFSRITIDFPGRTAHSMDLGFAADSLKAIPGNHVLARKSSDLNGLRQMAALHHLDLIRLVVESYGGRATLDQIQQVLVPDVITEDWKKWWDVAKRELKKDGHFQVPTKKTEPIVYQAQEVPLQERLMSEFRSAKGLKAHLGIAGEVLKSLEDLSDKKAAAEEVIGVLNTEIQTHQRTQTSLALEATFIRDELNTAAGLAGQAADLALSDLWKQATRLNQVLEQIPAVKHRRALQSYRECLPERWVDDLLSILNVASSKLCGECAHLLIHEGHLDRLKETVARLINQHAANSELLLWLAKERSDAFADILGPEVFRAMLTAMERDQFNEKRSNRLHDFILDDHELLVELIGSADLEIIKDVTRALQLSPCFDDMDKRSLLARIVKSYPAMQALITGDQVRQESSLVVSWESLERRKDEYQELVQKKIPANSKEIAIARSYGDLRENHEYKAAKEMQKLLMRRKSELESQLVRARGMDFVNTRTDVVSIGTRVLVTDMGADQQEKLTILGAWDSDPEKGVISYLSPVGQALLNKAVGEEVEFEHQGSKRRYRIQSIEAHQPGSNQPMVVRPSAEAGLGEGSPSPALAVGGAASSPGKGAA